MHDQERAEDGEERRRWKDSRRSSPDPAFGTDSISSFVLLWMNPMFPKIKCRKEPEKCSRGMTGLPPCSQQLCHKKQDSRERKRESLHPTIPPQTPKHREVVKRRALPWAWQPGATFLGRLRRLASSARQVG